MADWNALLGNAAFDAAVVTGAVSLIGWVSTRIYTLAQERTEAREKKRAAIVQFYTDVRLRAQYMPGVLQSASVEAFTDIIHDYGRQGRPLRFYGVQVSDHRSFDRINEYLHRLGSGDADLISEYMQLDRLFVIQYDKLQSKTFEALSTNRQIAAVADCALSARELQTIAERVEKRMAEWPELKRWRPASSEGASNQRSDRTHAVPPQGDAGDASHIQR